MVGLDSVNSVPNWLLILMEEKFFTPCLIHDSVKKNGKNIFCLDCYRSICHHCLPLHRSHLLLQIRRYMYNDVVRLGDAQRLLNCSLVQPYTTNRAKVLFLKQRPTSHPLRGTGNLCIRCDRGLQDSYIFCSLSCKVSHVLLITKCASTIKKDSWNKHEFSVLLDREEISEKPQEIEGSQMTPDSVLDSPGSISSSSGAENLKSPANWSGSEFLKKKRSSVGLVPRIWGLSRCAPAMELATAVNRRKGVPHRSPLY